MNDQSEHAVHENRHRTAHFFARLHRYRSLFRRRWWLLVIGGLVAMIIQGLVILSSPTVYSSVGRMIVNIKLAIPEGSVYSEELSNFLGTQAALMQSGVVINRATARLTADKPNQPAKQAGLRVNIVPKTTIFVLVATGGDKDYTQAFLEACMAEFINLKKDMRMQTSDTTLAGLTDEVLRLQRELRKCDDDLAAFQSSNSVVLLQEQGNSAGAHLVQKGNQLASLKFEYELLNTLTLDETLERQGGSGSSVTDLPSDGNGQFSRMSADDTYLKVKQQIVLLKADKADLGQYLRPKHPKMLALDDEIARRERLLEVYRQQSGEELDRRKKTMQVQIKTLEDDIKEKDVENLTISRKAAEYQRLKATSQRVQQLYDRLLATMQTLDVNKEISPESITIMEKATPASPERPSLLRGLITAALLGAGSCILLLLVLDRLDDRMTSSVEVERLFDEPVLGQIPQTGALTKTGRRLLSADGDDRHWFIESYRNLRSALLFMGESGTRPRSILVTSGTPDEGKSLTSANLAITLANAGSRVLLVDADLRKGAQHLAFEGPEKPGLSECLANNMHWVELVQKTTIPNLSLIPRGATTQRSGDLYMGPRMPQILKEMEAGYDYVLIDTVPVMAADDVASLAPLVDGVLFVLRAERTSARVARASLELLYQRQAHVMGLIFNSVHAAQGDYYHYHKYKNYYREYHSA